MSDNFKIMANIENHTQMLDYFIPLMRMMTKNDIVQYGLTGRLLRGGIVDYGEGKTRRGGANLKQWNIWRDQELNSGWMSNFLKLFDDREIGRIRIMRLKPRTCYSLHVDLTPRVHVPIITNSENFMIIDGEMKHLSQGKVWWTDTLKPHTALNTSERDRYHLLVEVSK